MNTYIVVTNNIHYASVTRQETWRLSSGTSDATHDLERFMPLEGNTLRPLWCITWNTKFWLQHEHEWAWVCLTWNTKFWLQHEHEWAWVCLWVLVVVCVYERLISKGRCHNPFIDQGQQVTSCVDSVSVKAGHNLSLMCTVWVMHYSACKAWDRSIFDNFEKAIIVCSHPIVFVLLHSAHPRGLDLAESVYIVAIGTCLIMCCHDGGDTPCP
jgi:hypothetical protein